MQEVPGGLSLPRTLPAGIPSEQQYVRMYCEARGLPYPLQASALSSLNWLGRGTLEANYAGAVGAAGSKFLANMRAGYCCASSAHLPVS